MASSAFPFLCVRQLIVFFFISFLSFFLSSLLGWSEMWLPDESSCALAKPVVQGASQNCEFDSPEPSKMKVEEWS